MSDSEEEEEVAEEARAEPDVPADPWPVVGSEGVEKVAINKGYTVSYKGTPVVKMTAWGNNISCQCMLHASCKMPALTARRVPSDDVLVNWALKAMSLTGELRISKAEHLALRPVL